jgi:hypothetical protein
MICQHKATRHQYQATGDNLIGGNATIMHHGKSNPCPLTPATTASNQQGGKSVATTDKNPK